MSSRPRSRERSIRQLVDYLQQSREQGTQHFHLVQQAVQELSAHLEDNTLTNLTSKEAVRERAIVSEYEDLFGRYDRSANILEPYTCICLEAIRAKDPKGYARLCLGHARVQYRRRAFGKARELVKESLSLNCQQDDLFGEALALLWAGKIAHRELDFAEARKCIYQAIEKFIERDRRKGIKVSTYQVALCRLCLAVFTWREGLLSEARAHLMEGQHDLQDVDDPTSRGSIEHLFGKIASSSGNSAHDYNQAMRHLQKALELYERAGHRTYIARVYNSQGHLLARRNLWDAAEEEFNKAEAIVPLDQLTLLETQYLRARLYLRWQRLAEAEVLISQLGEEAHKLHVPSLEAEIRISWGRILLARAAKGGMLRDAKVQARLAHDLNRHPRDKLLVISAKIDVAYNLLMAQILVREASPDQNAAQGYYGTAKATLLQIQNCFLEEWANVVRTELDQLDGAFRISPSASSLSYWKIRELIRFWLLRQAVERVIQKDRNQWGRLNRKAIEEIIDVKRSAFEKWLRTWLIATDEQLDAWGLDRQGVQALAAQLGVKLRKLH